MVRLRSNGRKLIRFKTRRTTIPVTSRPPFMTTSDDYREYRYEQTGDRFRLQSWHHGANRMQYGRVDERPEWVTQIVEVAAVAGAVNRAINPPPDLILWFRTDQDNNLTEFINI